MTTNGHVLNCMMKRTDSCVRMCMTIVVMRCIVMNHAWRQQPNNSSSEKLWACSCTHGYIRIYIYAQAVLHMCTLVMFMERHCTVGSNSSLPSFEWYASHVQHTELNQLYKWNAGCSLVVEHSMSTHEPASFELISSFPNIGTSIHPVKINRAMTDFKSCASNMAYVSLCPVLMPNMQTRV